MFGLKRGQVVICEIGTGHSGEMGTVLGKVGPGKYAIQIHETGQVIYTGAVKKYKGPARFITPNTNDGPNGGRTYKRPA